MGKEKDVEVFAVGGKRKWVRLKYAGLYDLDGLLGVIRRFMGKYHYVPVEVEHTEAVKTSGRELQIELAPFRNVSEYVRFKIGIVVLVWRDVEVVVQEGERKVPLHKADVELRFRASIEKNYKSAFKRTRSGEFFRQTYEKYLIPSLLSDYEDKVQAELEVLISEVKGVLRGWRGL